MADLEQAIRDEVNRAGGAVTFIPIARPLVEELGTWSKPVRIRVQEMASGLARLEVMDA